MTHAVEKGTGALNEELVGLVFGLVNRMREHFLSRTAEFDLSPPQGQALHRLSFGPMPMGELADAMRCDASNVTGIVDRLEARGLVERHPDPDDRRVRSLVLTADGGRLVQRLRERLFAGDGPFAGMPDADRRALRDLLGKIVAPLG